jgi:hypothetical protein
MKNFPLFLCTLWTSGVKRNRSIILENFA